MSAEPGLAASIAERQQQAMEYLCAQLGERRPAAISYETSFSERPLDGEGPVSLFSFDLTLGAGCAHEAITRHVVVSGETTPNYFPSTGLSLDEAYSVHIGTQFMLTMGAQRSDAALEPPGARAALHALLNNYASGATITGIELAGLFRCEEAYFAVYRVGLDGEPVYVVGADCPPGFHRKPQLAPQMILRLHIGAVIRAEASAEQPGGDA